MKEAILALEDGTIYRGLAAGAEGRTQGEVVFNTSLTGYQEILTDPSYAGQIVTMTCAEIGNYGVSPDDVESRQPQVAGFIIRDESPVASNWRAQSTLRDYPSLYRVLPSGLGAVKIENGAMSVVEINQAPFGVVTDPDWEVLTK